MAQTLVGTLRVLLSANTAEFTSELGKASRFLASWSKDLNKIGQSATALGAGMTKALTLPLVGLGAGALKAASDFESSFAGVRKTVDATDAEFAQMAQGFRNLAKEIPINVNDLNRLGEAAGALDIPKEKIVDFAAVMAKLGVTTNVTADQAAESIAQIQTQFKAAGVQTENFASALVHLGNNGASTEAQILELTTRLASAGNAAGMSQADVLGFAAAMANVGINAEAGGSALSKVFNDINAAVARGGEGLEKFADVAGMSSAKFAELFREDSAKALESFIQGLGRVKSEGGNLILTLDELGFSEIRQADTLRRLAQNTDNVSKALRDSRQGWTENTALAKEAEERFKTFDSQLKLVWAQVRDVGITLGLSLLPPLKDLLTVAKPVLSAIGGLAQLFAALPTPIRLVAVSAAALVAATGPVTFIFGKLALSAADLADAFTKKGIVMRGLTALFPSLTAATTAQATAATAATVATTQLTLAQRAGLLASAAWTPGMTVLAGAVTRLSTALGLGTAAAYASATASKIATVAKNLFAGAMLFVSTSASVAAKNLGLTTAAQYVSATASRVATAAVSGLGVAMSTLFVGTTIVGLLVAMAAAMREVGKAAVNLWEHLKAGKGLWEFITQKDEDNFIRRWLNMSSAAKKGADDIDAARKKALTETITGESLSKDMGELSQQVIDLANAGKLTTAMSMRVAEAAEQMKAQHIELSPVLQNVIDAYGREAVAARKAAEETDRHKTATGGMSAALRAAQAEITKLSAVQKQAIIDGDKLGLSNEKIAAAFAKQWPEVKLSEEAIKLYLDSLKSTGKTVEEIAEGPLKKLRTRIIELNAQMATAKGEGVAAWQIALEELGDQLIEVGRRAKMFGEDLPSELALAVKIAINHEAGQKEIERLRESWQFFLENRPVTVRIKAVSEGGLVPGQDAVFGDVSRFLEPFKRAIKGPFQKEIKDEFGKVIRTTVEQPGLFAGMLTNLKGTLAQGLGPTIMAALTGGGSVLKAVGGLIGQSLTSSLTKNLVTAFPKFMSSFIGQALGSFLPGIGALLGPLLGKVGGFFKGLFGGVSEEVKKAREEIKGFQDDLAKTATATQKNEAAMSGWADRGALTLIQVRDAFLQAGRSAQEAERLVRQLWDTGHPDRARRAMEEINRVMTESKRILEENTRAAGDLFDELMAFGAENGVTGQMRETIEKLISLGLLTDDQVKRLRGLGDAGAVSFQKMQAAADLFKARTESLGPAFNQLRLDETAKKYVNALDAMVRGGADVGGVLFDAKEELGAFVADAIRSKSAITESLKPYIEELFRTGQLLDENGEAITDISQIRWGAKMKTEAEQAAEAWDKILAKIDEFLAKLGKAAGISIPVPTEAPGGINVPPERAPSEFTPVPFAKGGIVRKPTLALIGEAGPEIIAPLHSPLGKAATELREPMSFQHGTAGMLGNVFGEFGTGTHAVLHGTEAVLTPRQLSAIVGDVIQALKPEPTQDQSAPLLKMLVKAVGLIASRLISPRRGQIQNVANVDARTLITQETNGAVQTVVRGTERVENIFTQAIERMSASEREALRAGMQGFQGTAEAFLSQQALLYHTAQEGDARLKTWLSGETIELLKSAEAGNVFVKAIVQMGDAELQALATGMEGFQGTVTEFLAEQAALYQHAREGDARLKTWLSGRTLETIKASETGAKHIDVLQRQQEAASDLRNVLKGISFEGMTDVTTGPQASLAESVDKINTLFAKHGFAPATQDELKAIADKFKATGAAFTTVNVDQFLTSLEKSYVAGNKAASGITNNFSQIGTAVDNSTSAVNKFIYGMSPGGIVDIAPKAAEATKAIHVFSVDTVKGLERAKKVIDTITFKGQSHDAIAKDVFRISLPAPKLPTFQATSPQLRTGPVVPTPPVFARSPFQDFLDQEAFDDRSERFFPMPPIIDVPSVSDWMSPGERLGRVEDPTRVGSEDVVRILDRVDRTVRDFTEKLPRVMRDAVAGVV